MLLATRSAAVGSSEVDILGYELILIRAATAVAHRAGAAPFLRVRFEITCLVWGGLFGHPMGAFGRKRHVPHGRLAAARNAMRAALTVTGINEISFHRWCMKLLPCHHC